MPELAELRLTAQYINESVGKLKFTNIKKNPVHKGSEVISPFEKFTLSSKSRGKELVVYLKDFHSDEVLPIRMTMGMSGHFRHTNTGQEDKHAHLKFYSTDGTTLSFVDVRRFGKWKAGFEWSDNRGPDPTVEFDAFVENVKNNLHKRAFEKPIMEVLMNQQYFNGIGNYLRAEILYRLPHVNPFQPARDVIQQEPMILRLCKEIPDLAFVLGGGRIKSWENPMGEEAATPMTRRELFQCYNRKGMSTIRDRNGRRFWFDPKWNTELV